MTQQQLEAILEWLKRNENRPISFIEKEVLKSSDLVRNLSNLANLR